MTYSALRSSRLARQVSNLRASGPSGILRSLFERFTERARQALVLAQEEARALKHTHIGTEHILLGLLREKEGLAARVLESLGITVDAARAEVMRLVSPGEEVTSGQIPFTARTKKVLEAALTEALSLGHNYIGTEHLLLGLVREKEGEGALVLLHFEAAPEKIRKEVIRMLAGPEARALTPVTQSPGVRSRTSVHVDPSAILRRLLMTAAARALDDGRLEIEVVDLLLAFTRDEATRALLDDLGVDAAAMREALESHSPPPGPP